MFTRGVIAVFIASGVALGGCQASASSQPEAGELLTEQRTTVLGEPVVYPTGGPAEITSSVIVLEPGASTELHHHDIPLYAYILEGTLTVDYADGQSKTYPADTAVMEAIGTEHAGRNDGDGPVRILAVYLGADGTPNSVVDE